MTFKQTTPPSPLLQAKIHSLDELDQFSKLLAKQLTINTLILLEGNLGTGKTALVKSLLNHFGLPTRQVKSPSFTLINQYSTSELPEIYHLDLYRLEKVDSIFLEEIRTMLNSPQSIVFIEWAERLPPSILNQISKTILKINLNLHDNIREITVNKLQNS
ncbi:MAG: tRNA (adenosine(37)-N6)-threonylcarbamoyltransferase complex ATPase subunit type 1 TsaE [Candidatus Altimarinota bacterium]